MTPANTAHKIEQPFDSTSVQTPNVNNMAEWQRIELLCLCLLQAKDGPAESLVNDLKARQEEILQLRETPFWHSLGVNSNPLAQDVLACVMAPQILPRVGWLYQDLQSSQQPAPSEALIGSLLALPDSMLEALRKTLWQLEHKGFIHREQADPFSPLHADKLALSRLMNWSLDDCSPPGAYPIKKRATWEQLILPNAQKSMLQEFLYWIKNKKQVVDEWGGQSVGGPVALFAGPSGTGKTLAASVIANELDWPLFRVDLAALVSKYIGETEKNIGRLFDATHGRNVILQFDEVDALMGKRGELREARDRYANMEVSYLLARIEEHDGPCVLTTNLRNQIDKAFCRRFQIVVEFPRPDAEQRQSLWKSLLPAKAPICDKLDLNRVAQSINFTGGQIRNAALHAAYIASAENTAIDHRCIAIACHREIAKEQSAVSKNELGGLAEFLPEDITKGMD